MIYIIINWIREHIGEASRRIPVEYRTEGTICCDDAEYNEISPYDAMAGISYQGSGFENSVPAGKQAI